MLSLHRDGRGLWPRPDRKKRGHTRLEPSLEALEDRRLLAGVEPTAYEQYMLELINRARANPAAEGQRLVAIAQSDPLIELATQGWNLSQFVQVIGTFGPEPPLAFNPRLIEAARDHDAAMLAANAQTHSPNNYLTDPTVATASDGQAFYPVGQSSWATGENIFAYSQNVNRASLKDYVDYYYEGFMLDWGNPSYDHLQNILAPGPAEAANSGHVPFSEIGVGLLANAVPSVPPPPGTNLNVGPVLVSQEFGWRSGNAFLTGAAYQDTDHNQFYTPGEGLGSVLIQAVGQSGQGTFQTVTWGSGGYSLQLPPGTYNVTASGNLPAPQSTVITIGTDNVGWDVRIDPSAQHADMPVPGDYDGDGRTDLAVFRPSTAQWLISGSSSGPQQVTFGLGNSDMPVPGNYDGPGKTEIAVYRPPTGQWFIATTAGPTRTISFGIPNVDIPVPGDYDGDGRTDLAVYRPTTGQWFILRSQAGPQIVGFGMPNMDMPVPGNYDGTGKTEIAVYRPPTGQWFRISPGGIGRVLTFGIPNLDVPIPGDYDGDGRTDFAVYRPTTGQWFVIRSKAGGLILSFGQPGVDMPVPGNYDGTSRSEFAVYRPTTAQWFIIGPTSGRIVQFGQGGISTPLALNSKVSIVSLGGQTSRFGISAAKVESNLPPSTVNHRKSRQPARFFSRLGSSFKSLVVQTLRQRGQAGNGDD